MDNKSKSSFEMRIAIISGICAIGGVLIGAAITGYFSIKTQTIQAEQQKIMFARQTAQNERQELKKILSDYTAVITTYYKLISDQKLKTEDLDNLAQRAFSVGIQIAVTVSLDLGQKTFELNEILMRNLRSKSQNKYSPEMDEQVIKKFMEWLVVAKGELKLLEYSATPENLTADLVRLFLRGAGSDDKTKK